MSAPRRTTRDERALLRGVVVIATLLALGRGLRWTRSLEDNARTRYEAAVRALSIIESRSSVPEPDSLPARFDPIRSETVIEAISTFSLHIEALARFANVGISAIAAVGDTSFVDGVARIGLRVSARATAPALMTFFREVDLGVHPARVSALVIRNADPLAAAGRADPLGIEFVLTTVAGRTFAERSR